MAKSKTITVNMRDEARLEMLKVVLDYESGVRGLSRGATLRELVMEAADTGSYPEDARAYLERLREERLKGVIEDFIAELAGVA